MMSSFLASARHARLLRLLDLERKVLLNGPLSALRPLVERREAALAEIAAADQPPPAAFLAALKTKAERNARLIAASLVGLRAAGAEIDAARTARESLRTYAADGSATDMRSAMSRDRRA